MASREPAPIHTRYRARRERGAALIVALILLVILTLLGVNAMNTTRLQERMASNSQEHQRAFEAAENGLSEAFHDNSAWNLSGKTSAIATTPGPLAGTAAGWRSTFVGFSPPPPNSGFDTSFQSAHFNFQATGRREGIVGAAGGNLDVIVNGGGYQIAPNPGG